MSTIELVAHIRNATTISNGHSQVIVSMFCTKTSSYSWHVIVMSFFFVENFGRSFAELKLVTFKLYSNNIHGNWTE